MASQGHHLSYIAEYTSDICHVAGVNNVVADALSRPPLSLPRAQQVVSAVQQASSLAVDLKEVAAHQLACTETQKLVNSSVLVIQPKTIQGVTLLCYVSRGVTLPVIPVCDRRMVFLSVHELAHPSARATGCLLSQCMVWRGMEGNFNKWVRDCARHPAVVKLPNSHLRLSNPFLCPPGGLATYTWILWGHFQLQPKVKHTSSR